MSDLGAERIVRDARDAVHLNFRGTHTLDGCDEMQAAVEQAIRAALALPTEPALDVERLENAMRAAARRYATGPGVDWPEEATPQAEWAHVIAAEYAKLARRRGAMSDPRAEALRGECPSCHHPDHDPGSCREGCGARCELHTDDALDFVLRVEPELLARRGFALALPTEPELDVPEMRFVQTGPIDHHEGAHAHHGVLVVTDDPERPCPHCAEPDPAILDRFAAHAIAEYAKLARREDG